MEGIVKSFFEFLTDKSVSLSRRSLITISAVIVILIINDVFGLSFNYRVNQKLDQIHLLSQIYSKESLESKKITEELKIIEKKILEREPFLHKSLEFIKGLFNNKLTDSQVNFLMRFLSASVVFIFLGLLLPFVTNKNDLKNTYVGLVSFIIVINLLLFLIPTFDKIYINHIINIVSSILSLVILGIIGSK